MYQKIYVGIIAEFLSEGGIRPRKLVYLDGFKYDIDRIKSIEKAPAKSGGFLTERYTCVFGDKVRYLYYEKSKQRWFIESAKGESYSS